VSVVECCGMDGYGPVGPIVGLAPLLAWHRTTDSGLAMPGQSCPPRLSRDEKHAPTRGSFAWNMRIVTGDALHFSPQPLDVRSLVVAVPENIAMRVPANHHRVIHAENRVRAGGGQLPNFAVGAIDPPMLHFPGRRRSARGHFASWQLDQSLLVFLPPLDARPVVVELGVAL